MAEYGFESGFQYVVIVGFSELNSCFGETIFSEKTPVLQQPDPNHSPMQLLLTSKFMPVTMC